MKRKNILCLCMTALLILGIAGCGAEGKDNSTGSSPVQESGESEVSGSENENGDSGAGEIAADKQGSADAVADPVNQQILYLWEEGNMPAVTEYTENNGNYADDPDFRPYMVTFPVPEGTEVKGAVLINAGGAFQFRSDQMEGTPVAQELSRLVYQRMQARTA